MRAIPARRQLLDHRERVERFGARVSFDQHGNQPSSSASSHGSCELPTISAPGNTAFTSAIFVARASSAISVATSSGENHFAIRCLSRALGRFRA
jgi:hypothetical protein